MRRLISSHSTFEKEIAYSRAVVQGNWIFVSGTTGYDYQSMIISDDLEEQTKQCFENIKSVLAEASASLEHIVRISYVLPDGNSFEKCWPIIRSYLGDIRPAATMFVAGLANDKMKIEIQVTAMLD